MLIYLHAAKTPIDSEALTLVGVQFERIPPFSLDWAEVFFNHLLKDERIIEQEIIDLEALEKKLKQIGALEKGRVYFRSTPTFDKEMLQSTSKFSSVEQIVHAENRYLGDDLRMVILTDYIRKEQLATPGEFQKLGVVPIFNLLHRSLGPTFPLAILTGSLIIIPKAVQGALEELAIERDISIVCKELPYNDSFVSIDITAQSRPHMVAMMTILFTEGHIRILIGTAALLGEGWDAPCINSLIMASFVGSFMLSNQMRGRAIRTDPTNPEKTSAIWHLTCVDEEIELGGYDVYKLRRRFRSLVGLHVRLPVIETGIERMDDFLQLYYTPKKVKQLNNETLERAMNRPALKQRWEEAIVDLKDKEEVQLRVDKQFQVRPIMYPYTLKAMLYGVLYTVITLMTQSGLSVTRAPSARGIRFMVILLFISIIVATAPRFWRILRLLIRYHSIDKFMLDIGKVLYDSLYAINVVTTPPKEIVLDVEEIEGILICTIRGGKVQEKRLLMTAWQQLLDPIENPRYLLQRKPKRLFFLKRKADYLPVPDEIGRRKEDAEIFCDKWNKQIEKASVHYTRTSEGRALLLKGRLEALSTFHAEPVERVSVWK